MTLFKYKILDNREITLIFAKELSLLIMMGSDCCLKSEPVIFFTVWKTKNTRNNYGIHVTRWLRQDGSRTETFGKY